MEFYYFCSPETPSGSSVFPTDGDFYYSARQCHVCVITINMCPSWLVDEGRQLFQKMKKKYGRKPRMEHYACMVNLLGRAGLIDDAYEIITKQMNFKAGPTVWGALLFACSLHGNVDVGENAAGEFFDLEPDNAHNFELLIKIYGNAGRRDKVESVMQSMADRGLDT